jgi:hypothetical protein
LVKSDPGIALEKEFPERSRIRRTGGSGTPTGSAPGTGRALRGEARSGTGNTATYPARSSATLAMRRWEELDGA